MTTKLTARLPPPTPMTESARALLNSRITMFKARIVELKELRARLVALMSEPPADIRPPPSIGKDVATIILKHHLVSWALFPIRELPTEIIGIIFDFDWYLFPGLFILSYTFGLELYFKHDERVFSNYCLDFLFASDVA